MNMNELQVRLRPYAQQDTYFTNSRHNAKGSFEPHQIPDSGTLFVSAQPHQPFEVCVGLDESFMPYSAQSLAVEIAGTSAVKRHPEEIVTQTWSIPLSKQGTAMKRTRTLEPELAREYQFGANIFWTRDKSPSKFSSVVHRFLVPAVGGRITVRIERGRLLDIEPRLPMKEHDSNPPKSPTEQELEGPTIIDKRWFERINGKNGKPITFVFEICDEAHAIRSLQSNVLETQCAGIDVCDDEEDQSAIKAEELPVTLKLLPTQAGEKAMVDQVQSTSIPVPRKEMLVTSYETVSSTGSSHCVLRPSRDGATEANYDTTRYAIDQYIDPAPKVQATTDQTEMPSARYNVGYKQFYPLDDHGQPIKRRGRPKGWRQHLHAREANGLEPHHKKSTAKRDVLERGNRPVEKTDHGQDSRLEHAESLTTTESKPSGQILAATRSPSEADLGSTLLGHDSGGNKEDSLSKYPPSDTTDSHAMKKAKLLLELDALEVQQQVLRVRKELLDLEESGSGET